MHMNYYNGRLPVEALAHRGSWLCYVCDSMRIYSITSGSAARNPSLYLAHRARPWLRMSQSYDLSDVDTTLMLFAAATVCSRTQSWQ